MNAIASNTTFCSLKIGFTLLLLVLLHPMNAQRNYLPGYVILNTKDTLHGVIEDRNFYSGEIYRKIKFKKKHGGSKRYSADDLLGYKAGATIFESLWYHEESDFLRTYYDTKPGHGQKQFLKVLSKGILNAYAKEFMAGDSSYPGSFPLLIRKDETYFVRATQGVFGLKKKQLASYFSDCPELAKRILDGSIKRMFAVVEYYNLHCIENF